MIGSGKLTRIVLVIFLGVTTTGCGPRLSEDELGRVVDRVPDIPGAEKPYETPQLGPRSEADSDADAEKTGDQEHSHPVGRHEH
jgi:hypothetical protein